MPTRPPSAGILCLLAAALACAGCQSQGARPPTGSASARAEALAGTQAAHDLEARCGGTFRDAAATTRLAAIVARFVAHTTTPPPDTVVLLASAELNAFSLPPARLYLTRGLYDHLPREALLAAAIAHELAHLEAHDSLKPPPVGSAALAVELAADRRAIELLTAAGYPSAALPELLAVVAGHGAPPSVAARRVALTTTD